MTTDIVTLSEATSYLGAPGDSALLPVMVSAISGLIDQECGPVVTRTVTERHDGGHETIFLRNAPVYSITSVTEYSGSTATTLTAYVPSAPTANDYYLAAETGMLTRRNGGSVGLFPSEQANITVVYVAGRATTTAAAPAKFKLACFITLQHMWKAEQGTGTGISDSGFVTYGPGFALPARALEILGQDARRAQGIG